MFRLVLVSALAALVAGAPKVRPIVPMLDGRIVGGEDTDITELPYQLSLEQHGSHICGASIITTTRALTAAHSTFSQYPTSFSVRAGSNIRGSGGQLIGIMAFAVHPQYNTESLDYDVSILFLRHPLELGPGVQPINFQPVGSELAVGTLATVSGWGRTSSGGASALTLKKVDVPRVGDATCQNSYESELITPRMTCHGLQEGGKDSCQGDSGGPLVAGGLQVGVVSWGEGCALPEYPGVYAKVSNDDIQNFLLRFL